MNQPAQTNKQTGKRIVSKGEYAKAQGKRVALLMATTGFGLITAGCGLIAITALAYSVLSLLTWSLFWKAAAAVSACIMLVFGIGTVIFYYGTKATLKSAKKIVPGVPLTRANTADLPAPDSLVRASEEPKQEQQSVLLRAATETQERHEEQLLRASKGQVEGDSGKNSI